jgi:SAM-dependent methyltransferase
MPRTKSTVRRRRVLLNAGCGKAGNLRSPRMFRSWSQIRVDIDPDTEPDILANVSDLSAIPDGAVDAIWCAHCIEHLFPHEVPLALSEFRRVLRDDGFACIIVPDLQEISHWIANDRLHETIYESSAGPVTAHDMVWGYGPAIERGATRMAHHCGFTPTLLLDRLKEAGFAEIVLRRRKNNLELAGLALQKPSASAERRKKRMTELGL